MNDQETAIPDTTTALVHNPLTHLLSLQSLSVPAFQISNTHQGYHIIRVHAVALTNGELAWPEPSSARPAPVPGYEVAGTVVMAPGPDSPFQPGTEVYARTGFDRPGNARQYSEVLADELGRKPRNLSWEEACTVPLSALTAWQALFVHGGLVAPENTTAGTPSGNRGKRVLVTAAAGGVGIWAVQLARLAGVEYIVATCGPTNMDFVKSLGAHEVRDYTSSSGYLSGCGESFDLVLDCVGGQTLETAWTCAKPGGRVISVAIPANLKRPDMGVATGVQTVWFIVAASSGQLEKITELIELGFCKPAADSIFAMDEFEKAFSKVHSGHLRGKVVLRI